MDTPTTTAATDAPRIGHTLFPLIVTDDVRGTLAFYEALLGMTTIADVGWYVQLALPSKMWMQLGLIDADHESVPATHRRPPAGVIVTVEVDDVDAVHDVAQRMGAAILSPLRTEAWGQRHFITEDPAGLLVDVVTPIPPDPAFLAAHGITAD